MTSNSNPVTRLMQNSIRASKPSIHSQFPLFDYFFKAVDCILAWSNQIESAHTLISCRQKIIWKTRYSFIWCGPNTQNPIGKCMCSIAKQFYLRTFHLKFNQFWSPISFGNLLLRSKESYSSFWHWYTMVQLNTCKGKEISKGISIESMPSICIKWIFLASFINKLTRFHLQYKLLWT